ncbi:ABC transporter substrate-binding protein [Corynebacterium sp. ES2794-CONJ1]|uniref:ABC transporter substrate-binding protein n=1 Tax=unclassified Corynebacterium TaxID=2624378 RepID=UPI0021672467|nr:MULTISPECIES: ABC transporter substrate-binding protein [unclassified Corynebacterium]MCS4489792.1 ABC transporter substrate-binding protein [Corynebacterium sp. ES2775-CONJ]MCS4491844.1 ABC transporter substrate-binding protein [Corynebacterium sp. ES2715-CONJ3]MCS4531949.1 ABC transporter substrate-binding protein [Corynebacterium sp. ES2730-CONJ]MCU9519350.1 ABC transporter substrate-binding protein [Corynebacterium sp. ES2794-CONJ1]
MKNIWNNKSIGALVISAFVLTGCANNEQAVNPATSGAADSQMTKAAEGEGVTVTNCGEEVTFSKADNLFVNDGNIISIVMSAGARENIKYVSSVQRDMDILRAKYGEEVDGLVDVAEQYPSLEEIVSKQPDIYVAGWGYGFSEGKNITPEALKEQGIDSYFLTESCRQEDGDRGIVDPWTAVTTDIKNIAAITGHKENADKVVADINSRLNKLENAAKAEKTPVGFLFDSGSDTIFTSGRFGAPQAILEAAGSENAAADIDNTWTTVSWEQMSAKSPDFFVFVEYPGQEFDEKVKILKEHPVTKDLPAVKENRFINLPYAMWTSGPLNIDAAEHVRKGLEKFDLVPASNLTPKLDLPDSVPGKEFFVG